MNDEPLPEDDLISFQQEAELQEAMYIFEEIKKTRTRNLAPFRSYFFMGALVIGCFYFFFFPPAGAGTSFNNIIFAAILIGSMSQGYLNYRRDYNACETIIRSHDFRTIAMLIHIVRYGEVNLGIPARHALARILSENHAKIKTLLPERDRVWLMKQLAPAKARTYPEFAIAIFEALERISDEYIRKPVRVLAELRSRDEAEMKLSRAARECLARIEARTAKVAEKHTLLRASSAVSASPDALLRPASAAGQTHEAELLRPLENEQAE